MSASILLLLVLASVAVAAESRSLPVVCRGALPFGQQELLRAINLRLPLMRIQLKEGLPAVEVNALSQDRTAITVGSSRRVISLVGLSGADAVRIVALLSLDLISNQQGGGVSVKEHSPSAEPETPKGSDFIFIGVSPRLTVGVTEWTPTFEPTLDLGIKVSRYFLLYVEAGVTWASEGKGASELTLYEIPVKAGAGFRYAWFEARAGVALRPYFVRGAGEDQGALIGGGLGLYYRHSFSASLTGYAGAGVDFYSRRKEFRVGGETVLSTSWAVPWLGIGAGWQGG